MSFVYLGMPKKIDFTNINGFLNGGNVFLCIGSHTLYAVVLLYVSGVLEASHEALGKYECRIIYSNALI